MSEPERDRGWERLNGYPDDEGGRATAAVFEVLSPAQEIVIRIVDKAKEHGFSGTAFAGFLEWLEEKLAEPNMAEPGLVRILQVAQAHGYPDTDFEGFLEWLGQRLESSDHAVLKEGELEPDPLFSSPKQPDGPFARQLRRGQERSAQQAMVIMANDLQKAYQTIERLRSQLSTDLSFPLSLSQKEQTEV